MRITGIRAYRFAKKGSKKLQSHEHKKADAALNKTLKKAIRNDGTCGGVRSLKKRRTEMLPTILLEGVVYRVDMKEIDTVKVKGRGKDISVKVFGIATRPHDRE